MMKNLIIKNSDSFDQSYLLKKFFLVSGRVKGCLLLLFVISIFLSCTYDKGENVSVSDATLFDLIKTNAGYQYYKNSSDTLTSDPDSPHKNFVRVRFNSVAAASMNNDLSNLTGARFADGSIVVKEIFNSPGDQLNLYAVMFKTSVDNNTSGGWIWAEYRPNGDVFYSTNKKGDQCTGCHSVSGNVDFVRTFALH